MQHLLQQPAVWVGGCTASDSGSINRRHDISQSRLISNPHHVPPRPRPTRARHSRQFRGDRTDLMGLDDSAPETGQTTQAGARARSACLIRRTAAWSAVTIYATLQPAKGLYFATDRPGR